MSVDLAALVEIAEHAADTVATALAAPDARAGLERVAERWPLAELDALLAPGGLDALPIDHSVAPVSATPGGSVEADERLLPQLDARLGRVVARRLRDLGMSVMTSARARGLQGDRLQVSAGDEDVAVDAEKVVVAVGRVPNTDDLGLERAGL